MVSALQKYSTTTERNLFILSALQGSPHSGKPLCGIGFGVSHVGGDLHADLYMTYAPGVGGDVALLCYLVKIVLAKLVGTIKIAAMNLSAAS